jgi:peptidyl-prolyl cis-trans isomerase SurA
LKLKLRLATLLLVSAGFVSTAVAQEPAPAVSAAPQASDAAPTADATPLAPAADTPAAPANQQAALAPASTINASTTPDADDADGIAATVNDESISDYELRQRMSLFIATSGLHPSTDDLKRIRGQTLDRLEDEKIQLQEAVKKHITVSPVEVDKAINNLLDQNHITIEQLRTVLASSGSSELTLRSQITAQLAWQKTVQDQYSDLVNISQPQIDAEVQRYADGANKPHFLVNEIFLPVTKPELDAKVLQDAQSMESQLQAGAQFGALAHQFSQNPAAAQGGSIGWVHEGQLSNELNDALVKMTQGQVSPPVRAAGGYYILQLAARQEPAGTKIAAPTNASTNADGTLPLARLLLPLGSAPTQEIANAGMEAGNQIRKAFAGCDQLKALAGKMTGAVYMDLGNMKPADLSPDIQKALAQTQPGEATVPILSDAGVEIIARCDQRIQVETAYEMPSRTQVEEELFNAQISALAQRYMRDLKRDADVEVR